MVQRNDIKVTKEDDRYRVSIKIGHNEYSTTFIDSSMIAIKILCEYIMKNEIGINEHDFLMVLAEHGGD